MDAMEMDKSFAVFGDANAGYDSNYNSIETDRLIKNTDRLQLNTYQAFVRNFMNPRSDASSLLLVHMTGTGKTITALATATEYVKQYIPSAEHNSVASIIVLGFTKNIFKNELLTHPEFLFVNMDDANDLKRMEKHMHESQELAEKYYNKRKVYMRRLVKREAKGIYQFYGYKQFANKIINMNDIYRMMKSTNTNELININHLDPILLTKWIKNGDVKINISLIQSFAKSLIICDEVHNLYKEDRLNTYGIAIKCVLDYFNTTTDLEYKGCIRSMMLSATPLTSSALEIIPIVSLLSGITLKKEDIFVMLNGVDSLTAAGLAKIRQCMAGKISYIMDDNPTEYPSVSFVGQSIPQIKYLKFVRTKATGVQLNCIKHWNDIDYITEDRGGSMAKDIVLPATNEFKYGTIFGNHIIELANLPADKAVRKLNDGTMLSSVFKMGNLFKYSSKYSELVRICMNMRSKQYGKIFVYHPMVQGSGTDMIVSILMSNGFLFVGDVPTADSVCMDCDNIYSKHSNADHDFHPVVFTLINGNLSKRVVSSRLDAFNSEINTYGESIKIIIGSKAMRESHTLRACKHIIITHEPSSISEMIQIIGRAVRKNVHAMLPPDMRTVEIRILTTDITDVGNNDPTINEEEAYKAKVLQYEQIIQVDRLLYDVAIDYLINFRFKTRETAPLFGETYPLDTKRALQYHNILDKAYASIAMGISSSGIHTSRFNLFYMESEAKLVIMIIKRVLLDFQPVLTIDQLKTFIRTPPFHIEYNTKLISDEAIALAIHQIVFSDSQLRVINTDNNYKLEDSLFDMTSIVIDHDGQERRVITVGDPLCSDSYVMLKRISEIISNDKSIISVYKRQFIDLSSAEIDTVELFDMITNVIDIDDILNDIETEISSINSVKDTLLKLSIKTHILVAEWAIKTACDFAVYHEHVKNINMLRMVVDFYINSKLMVRIMDLEYTRVYDRFSKYNKLTQNGWWDQVKKPSLASLPICHMLGDQIMVYDIPNKAWLSLTNISDNRVGHKYLYNWYIYEEQIPNTLNVVNKIKFITDKKKRGITLEFLQKTEIKQILDDLKIQVSTNDVKKELVSKIVEVAFALQKKIYPKRVAYHLVDL